MAFDQVMTSYVGHGTHAARPATPNVASGVSPIYYETDTTNSFIWTGSAWVQVNGSSAAALAEATKTANYTITSSDDIILGDATSGAFTVTLPTAVGWTKRVTIKKIDSSTNAVTVGTTSSQTIDGATTRLLKGQFSAVTLISDNSNWRVTEEALPLTSKGDLLAGLASNDLQRLAVGTDAQVLVADSAQATGLKYALLGTANLAAAAGILASQLALTTQTTFLTSDGTIAGGGNNTFYHGPTTTCAAGTWWLYSSLSLLLGNQNIIWEAKLWDGTTAVVSTKITGIASGYLYIALGAVVAPGSSTTYKLSVNPLTDSSGDTIKATVLGSGGTNIASFIQAIRVG